MRYQVKWAELAVDQLAEAALYIAYNTGSIEEGKKFKDVIIEETDKLDILPDRGIVPRDRSIRKKGFRGLIIGNYIAFYKVYQESQLVVVEVFVPLKSDYKRLIF